jgi:hypothetical protein
VIVIVAAILAAVALLGTGLTRVALGDVAALETQEAAQRAAEAAAGRAADLRAPGTNSDAQIDAATQDEATAVAAANLSRGSLVSVSTQRSSSATEYVRVQVTLNSTYGGMIGPLQLSATGTAAVPRTP